MRNSHTLSILLLLPLLAACETPTGTLDDDDDPLQVGDVRAGDVQAGDVLVEQVSVEVQTVQADDVLAGGVQASGPVEVNQVAVAIDEVPIGAVNAGTVDAGDVFAGDVLTGDVNLDVTIEGELAAAVAPGLAADVAALELVWTGFDTDPAAAWSTAAASACSGGVPRSMAVLAGPNLGEVGVLVAVDCP